eukprot:TRINITY_DN170_c0_g1_i2.p1 TRINITY_DN170_c0_g1~~TRINITY_DN170_c0_g1_i2.p1  ORF type:complete len:72 (+),score=14.35 TRINITY_DN170_c0_g1_i2:78-293(+)
MDVDVLFSAEQIKIPPELASVLKEYTKNVIRSKPTAENLHKWSANYFAKLAGLPEPFPEVDVVIHSSGATR